MRRERYRHILLLSWLLRMRCVDDAAATRHFADILPGVIA